ncbi:MAG: hypothetical protein BEN19_02545 [Epulopiscium sp. Nuni2H_MBin003]|nr:MAG: hypothetical protein BEN19_02545 [Epulopiscium sp. Nuni2H_MBin003]
MKNKILNLIMMFLLISLMSSSLLAQEEQVRAVWITTVANSDFPKNIADAQKQQEEFVEYITALDEIGINTIMVQVRPLADALYKSDINPWSSVLTGVQGQDPGYDPLAFIIEEAHKRGIKVHAWLNPYRVTNYTITYDELSSLHPARLNPNMVFTHNNAWYYNPELESVKVHIEQTVQEIVRKYDVDGIHFDDYFYPSGYPLPEGESGDGVTANNRRYHVNDMVRRVYEVVKETDSNVEFGISPMGIWKNDIHDITGSNTSGGESYYDVYADTRMWIQNGWIDYVVPQIYWEIGNDRADYETLVKWWNNEVKGTDVNLYIGQGIYKDVVAEEIIKQLQINDKYNEVDGSIFFTMDDLLDNRGNAHNQLQEYYKNSTVLNTPPIIGEELKIELDPSGNIQLIINNQLVIPEVAPYLENDTTLVPTRVIAENLGAVVKWDNNVKMVTIEKDTTVIKLKIGDSLATVNEKEVQLLLAPKIIDGTTMVPVRMISDLLNADVVWDQNTKTIRITAN